MDELDQLEQLEEKDIAEKKSHKSKASIKKKDDENTVRISFLETPDYILEQISNADDADDADATRRPPGSCFARYSKLNDTVDYVEYFSYKNKMYYPIVDDIITKNGILLPTAVKEYKNTKEITDNIYNYFQKNMQLPRFFERFLPHLVLFYWVYEKFPFIPYVHFVGSTGTGKSTAMEVFGSICYKTIETTGSLTVASMFRVATSWKGTLLIDEFDKVGENINEIYSFLKAGVSDKLVIRTEGEGMKQLRAYVVKSPKIFTSENPIGDAGLQSRTMVVKMEKNDRKIPLYRLKEDNLEAQEIRNQLLLWRFRNFNKINLQDIKYGFEELRAFDSRVQQIITPVYYFSDEETKKDILEFAKEQQQETMTSRRESLPGNIFEIMLDIWNRGEEVQVKNLTSLLNEEQRGKGYKTELTEKKISNIIRKILGFDLERRGHDRNAWVIRNTTVESNKKMYYDIEVLQEQPQTPQTPQDELVDAAEDIFK
jgi:hypothetical protein